MGRIWKSVKRNPVILATLSIIALQFAQDYLANQIDWQHFSGYLFTLVCGAIARNFVTPTKEARAAYMRGLSTPRATPGIPFEEGDAS